MIIVLPAGTTGNPSRDLEIIKKIQDSVGAVEWAVQVPVPKRHPTEYTDPSKDLNVSRPINRALRDVERLPAGLDHLFLDYEIEVGDGVTHEARGEVLSIFAEKAMARFGRPISGSYACPRINQAGVVKDALGWALEARWSKSVGFAPRAYWDYEDKEPQPLDKVVAMARALDLSMFAYVGGQYKGDGSLVPQNLLVDQAVAYRPLGITPVVWCNISMTDTAVLGMRRCVEAWRETA